MSVFDELNGLASPVEAIVPIFLVIQIVSNDSGDQLVEVGAPVLADLQNDFIRGARQETAEIKTHQLQRVISTVELRNSTAAL